MKAPENGGGTLSMAREVYAGPDGQLHQRPVQEIINYFNKPVSGLPNELSTPQDFKVPANYMLHCSVGMGENAVMSIGFREQPGNTKSGYKLIINPRDNFIELKDTGARSVKYPCTLDVTKPVDIRVFVVNDIIECYVNNAYVVSMHAYNYKDGQLSFQWDGSCSIKDIKVNIPMK